MPVTSVHKDPEALTMLVNTELDAPVALVWRLWEDPRRLERWWGPPAFPATFVDHDLTPGATCTYFMTGPEGDRHHGWWRVRSVEPPRHFELEDGFADDEGRPNAEMPTTVMRVELHERPDGGTRMSIETRFPSRDAMEQMIAMGMEEGIAAALGQIDDILRADASAR